MIAYSLFSGSSGNCIYVKKEDTEILIDVGGSMKRVETALNEVGSTLSQISAIFLTHEHIDHVQALPVISKRCAIPVYCPEEVARDLYLSHLNRGKTAEAAALAKCIRTVLPGEEYEIGSVLVTPFATPHDSVASFGYILDDRVLGIATDLGEITSEVRGYLLGCQSVILESNYDRKMLFDGPYPLDLKERVASGHGHLCNRDCAAFSKELWKNGCRNFTLYHLSEENNTPEIAREETLAVLRGEGECVADSMVRVAKRYEVTKVL